MTAPATPPDSAELRALLGAGRFRDVLARITVGTGGGLPNADIALLGATAATRLGELDRAMSLATSAFDGFRLRRDVDGEARSVNLLGAIAWERGVLDEAEQRFGSALTLAGGLDDDLLEARAANNIAAITYLRGNPEVALGMYQSALASYQRLGDRRGTAETYHNIGIVYRMLGSWREAEGTTDQALRQAELVGEPSLIALVLGGRAELEIERGQLMLADRGLTRAAELAAQAGDDLGLLEIQRLQALALLRAGSAAAAAAAADSVRLAAAALGSALLLAESAAVAALAHRELGATAEAETRAREARSGYQMLGAQGFLARFDREWEELG